MSVRDDEDKRTTEDEQLRRRVSDNWHVGKEVPIVFILAILAQTAGGIWWLSALSSKIDAAVLTIQEFRSERYTREDARRDRELIEQKLSAMQSNSIDRERRINGLELRVDRMDRK